MSTEAGGHGLTQLWKAAKSIAELAWSAMKSWPVC